jgi:lipopolysaccharide/colanic/teichoic acid biosynthesis glycosyltransferase
MLKRTIDIVFSALILLLSFPFLIVIVLLIKLSSRGPALFHQARPGLHGKPFTIVKFRTMSEAKDASGNLLPDAQRLTSVGKFLRRTSLDEVPELINVLRGEMSLVGPRPLLIQYLPRYTAEQARRHDIKPGITGWAQVNGRNALTWEEKFRLDVWYVDHQSFILDIKIAFKTLQKLITREGISAEGHATMPEFRGSAPNRQ